MDDVSSQDEAVKTLKKAIEEGNVCHVATPLDIAPSLASLWTSWNGKDFCDLGLGPRALWVEVDWSVLIFRPEMKNRVLELNASDERGIDVGKVRMGISL